MKRLWVWFLAFFRLNKAAVCELSRERGLLNDYHDYDDTAERRPDHFTLLTCERCGKEFMI